MITLFVTFCTFYSFTRRQVMLDSSITTGLSKITDFKDKLREEIIDILPIEHEKTDDPYARWSFFDLTPPPIEKVLTYEELVVEAKNNSIISVQIAVQHDCVIATTTARHRIASIIKDEDFDSFLLDCMDKKGNLPFLVLPIDKGRTIVRNVGRISLDIAGGLWLLDCFGFLPWDTTPYASIKQRNESYGKISKRKNIIKVIKDFFHTNTTKY